MVAASDFFKLFSKSDFSFLNSFLLLSICFSSSSILAAASCDKEKNLLRT